MRKAFTMVELVFVIVIIGILSGIAISKMGATRDDASITKAKSTVASIRSAISSEVQRRMMEGNYTVIKNVGGTLVSGGTTGYDAPIFDFFDTASNGAHSANASRVLEYAPHSCKTATSTGCWIRSGTTMYIYYAPGGIGGNVDFNVSNNRFDCDGLPGNNTNHKKELCRMLDR